MTNRFFAAHVLGPDLHANRPSASTTPDGALYECTTHGKFYKNDNGTWVTYGVLVPPGGSTGQVLSKASSTDQDVAWSTPGAGYTDEQARDAIGAALVAGTNMTITVNDAGDTITLDSSAGGGGGAYVYPTGSADKPPVSPNAKDDEFDGTSSVTWSSTPTAPTTWDINTTRPGYAYLKDAAAIGSAYAGKVQPVPGAYPYTIVAKFLSNGRAANSRRGGVILGPTAPIGTSNVWYMGGTYVAGIGGAIQERIKATFAGTYVNDNGVYPLPEHWGAYYIKVKVNSATSVDCYASVDGWCWIPIEVGANPGFTPGVMGIAATAESAVDLELYCDFFRVT